MSVIDWVAVDSESSIDVALFAAADWLSNDEGAFWTWAARHAPERCETPVDAFAQAMKQLAAGMTLFAEAKLLEGGPRRSSNTATRFGS